MRTLLALTLVLVVAACGSDRRDSSAKHDSPSASSMSGPDPIVLRVPRGGGPARAYVYPRLDSVAWTSRSAVPAPDHVLAFDEDAGLLAFVDAKGRPGRLDLRSGGVSMASKPALSALSSSDGSTIYGLAAGGVTRLTPAGSWAWKPPAAPRAVYPIADGTLLVSARRDSGLVLWKIRPPDEQIADSVVLPDADRGITSAGDRVYFTDDAGDRLLGVRPRDLSVTTPLALDGRARAIAATPSGDRLYVASDSSTKLSVVDRYAERVSGRLELPGQPGELRMGALGRYLLVQQVRTDSAWVVDIGTDRVIGSVATQWRDDLPAVAPDGSIAVVRGRDVVFVDGETLRPRRTIAGGAGDFWHFLFWNGFRPRAAGLDEPVSFQQSAPDSSIWGVPMDSTAHDSGAAPLPASDTTRPAPAAPAPSASGWTVSFAAVLDEGRARELAAKITVEGQHARVATSTRTGTPVYRVVLGPFPTKPDAERVGQLTGQSFWVYQGAP